MLKGALCNCANSRVDCEGGEELGPGDGRGGHRLEALVVPLLEQQAALILPAEDRSVHHSGLSDKPIKMSLHETSHKRTLT